MVYFVGAGPGAVDLITVRGGELIKTADVIIYAGSLVNVQLLETKKASAEVHNSAAMTLEEVVETIAEAEEQGKITVRLHTGDPSIYGAIGEQITILKEKNIQYQVVPGVSSFCGAAAAIKAEYTIPNISQSVIITRAEGRTPVPEKESIASLAAHGTSMVIFLSTGLLDSVTEQLIAGGYKLESPAAIVYKASWDDEKIVRTTVGKLKEDAATNNITKTALILVGEFLNEQGNRSLLYHPEFSHEFREARREN